LNRAKLQNPFLLAGALAGVALLVVGAPSRTVLAQSPAATDDAKKKLEDKQLELENVKKRTQTLQSDVDELATERERLNSRLVETAALIKRSEAQLTTIESRMGELEEQQRALKGSLSQRHDQIAKLLSALQRMGRNPPPVLITQREDALAMVRSAMLLAAAFPELGNQARDLATRLTQLVAVMTEIRTQGEQLRAEMTRLTDARTRLSGLLEAKKVSLDERQSELKRMRVAAAEISKNVTDLNELISRLDQAVKDNTGLGAYDEERRRNPAPVVPPKLPETPPAPPAARGPDGEGPIAAPPAIPKSSDMVELMPGAALGSPGRIKPEIAFAEATARLPMPAQGRQVLGFGEKTQYGGQSKGIVLETRQGAQVTSPCDGWIVYAGEFRSYGQLLIINGGGGYHVLLAGLSQIDVQPGQFVLAAEPVGTMSGWSQQAQPAAMNNAPVLYVEFRKDGRPIDPDPWWVTGHQKVQG
jgi:septal ring factor EnvC (AmiA/AmiB activator)